MPRGRRKKIEVPTGTQSQFELGDTTEDIERGERGERDEKERTEQEERDRERMEKERREESQERGENRAQTDTDTDTESTQSRQKGQIKSIFLSDSDEQAIMEFVKQLYDKTNNSFKDKQKEERLWESLAATRNLPVKTTNKWFETQCSRYGKLTQTKPGEAAEKSTERQTWLKDSFNFLRGHIRRKEVFKSSVFKSPQRSFAAEASPQRSSAAEASASVPDTSRGTESEMEISIASDVTHQPLSTSPKRRQPTVATTTTAADPVLDQFQQMRSMISTFLYTSFLCTSGPHSKSKTVVLQLSPL